MSHSEVVGYYERSKAWNELSPLPHRESMQVLLAKAVRGVPESTPPHLICAEVGALPGREIVAPFGGAVYYHIDDEKADLEGVLFHDIQSGPLENKYHAVAAGLLTQEFDDGDSINGVIDNLVNSSSKYLVLSRFRQLFTGCYSGSDNYNRLPPRLRGMGNFAPEAHGLALVSSLEVSYRVSDDDLKEYIKVSRDESSFADHRDWKRTFFSTTLEDGYEVAFVCELFVKDGVSND